MHYLFGESYHGFLDYSSSYICQRPFQSNSAVWSSGCRRVTCFGYCPTGEQLNNIHNIDIFLNSSPITGCYCMGAIPKTCPQRREDLGMNLVTEKWQAAGQGGVVGFWET